MLKLYVECYWNGEYASFIPYSDMTWLGHIYAHGELERLAKYDIVDLAKDDKFDFETDRIEDVIAVLADGKEIPSKFFYWKDGEGNPRSYHHGFVIKADDTEALEYATKCYEERSISI